MIAVTVKPMPRPTPATLVAIGPAESCIYYWALRVALPTDKIERLIDGGPG